MRASGAMATFQSTPSTRRETLQRVEPPCFRGISIHSLHTEGDIITVEVSYMYCISIHSLHTEGDASHKAYQWTHDYFNPLPPHGGRPTPALRKRLTPPFQSTPSTRRETSLTSVFGSVFCISIHSLHTEGDDSGDTRFAHYGISIHSLHTEGDEDLITYIVDWTEFQSTPSTRRETAR